MRYPNGTYFSDEELEEMKNMSIIERRLFARKRTDSLGIHKLRGQ